MWREVDDAGAEQPLPDAIRELVLDDQRSQGFMRQLIMPQEMGIKEVAEKIWLVTFMHYDLGFFDHETGRVECAPNPFEAQVLPMSPE